MPSTTFSSTPGKRSRTRRTSSSPRPATVVDGSPTETMPCTAPESFRAIDSAWSSWRSMNRA